jgi:hypothetical protein
MLRYEICLSFDNKESSIGVKRQKLLETAKGKYMSFIDDDDDITDAYIEDLWACIQGGFHTMRLRGQMSEYPFVHSIEITLDSPMATLDTPPVFQRPPNHLNPMLTEIAKCASFKDAFRGEDLDWALSIFKTGFLRKEYRGDPSRTHYIYNLGDRVSMCAGAASQQQSMTYGKLLSMVFSANGYVQPAPLRNPPGPRPLRLGTKGFVSK